MTTPNTTDYKLLLESTLQVLRAISHAQIFRDQRGDKVIQAHYADLADSEVRMIEGIIESNKNYPKKNWSYEDRAARVARTQAEMDDKTGGYCPHTGDE